MSCNHAKKGNLGGANYHQYCTCGTHWYRGKIWTAKEWSEYVNDPNCSDEFHGEKLKPIKPLIGNGVENGENNR